MPFRAGALALPFVILAAFAEAKTTNITLLHINDVYEISPVKGKGGLAPLMTLLRQERQRAEHNLFTVGGDFLSPSLLSGLTRGKHMIEMFDAIGVDYVVFGNHEFDYGPQVAAERLRESNFPWLGTNVLGSDGKPFAGAIATATRKYGDITVGLFGVLTPQTAKLARVGNEVTFAPVIETAERAVRKLKAEGADVILALTHLDLAEDRELGRRVKGIDVILGGHDHDSMTFYEHGVLIAKAESDARYLLSVDLRVEKPEGGGKIVVTPAWRYTPTAGVAHDPQIAALVKQYEDELDRALNVPIGVTSTELDSSRGKVRGQETAIGNLFADAIRLGTGADIGLMNGGGLRGDRVYPAGRQLTRRDILTEMPFGNVTVVIELAGADLRAALEHGVSQVEEGSGRFPQVSGVTFSYDPRKPAGARVTDVKVNGQPLEASARYRIGTTDYLAGGGDGYDALTKGKTIVDASGATLTAVTVMDYVSRNGTVAPVTESRIRRIE